MAKLQLNPLVSAIGGSIGDLEFVREGDRVYIRRKAAKVPRLRSSAQVAHTSQFGVASRWARTLLADPAMRVLYQKACHDHLTPHNIAVKDYMHPPVIEGIDLESYTGNAGDVIRILAADDFKIVRVTVQILTVDRQILEEGEAGWDGTAACWAYSARTQMNPGATVLIEAAALDLPGNRSSAKAYFYVAPPASAHPLSDQQRPTTNSANLNPATDNQQPLTHTNNQ